MRNDLDDQKLCVSQIEKHTNTHTHTDAHDTNRTNGFCDTIPKFGSEDSLCCDWTKQIEPRIESFIGKLDFVSNVNLLKCVHCFCWSQNGRCKRWFSMFICSIYCIRFQMCGVVWTHTISTFQKHHWQLGTTNGRQELTETIERNSADNFDGNTIDEHRLLLQFMCTFMQLGDKFVWTMVSHGNRDGKSVYQHTHSSAAR